MTDLNAMIDKREKSADWDRGIAGRVLSARKAKSKRARIAVLAMAASIALIAGAGLLYQNNEEETMRGTFDSVMADALPHYSQNMIVSKEVDDKIVEYCMNK